MNKFERLVLFVLEKADHSGLGYELSSELPPMMDVPLIEALIRESRAVWFISFGRCYAALERLEAKGYVRYQMAPGSFSRRWLQRKLWAITDAGKRALNAPARV